MKFHTILMMAFCVLIANPTLAAKPSAAKQHEAAAAAKLKLAEANKEEAKQAFQQGDYEKAIKLFEAAYTVIKQPAFVYNIARCLEELHQYKEALEKFNEYLQLPDVDDQAKAETRARMTGINAILNPPPAPPIVGDKPKVDVPPAVIDTPVEQPPDPMSKALTASIIGTSALALTSAAVMIVAHNKFTQSEETFNSIKTMQDVDAYSEQLDDYKTWRNVRSGMLIAVGVGATITGYLVWDQYRSPHKRAPATTVVIVPNTTGGGTLALTTSF